MQGLAKQSINIMFTSFLFERLTHYRQFYSTEAEFIQHLMSGEVKISIPDLIKFQSEYENKRPSLPSRFQVGDKVIFEARPDDHDIPYIGLPAEILAVHFYSGKVKYDVDLIFAEGKRTRIYNVDSIVIVDFDK